MRDEAAFTALVRRHGPMVLAVCRRVLRDAHTAEDAFQATFLVLARKAASLSQPELLGHWLHGVAYRTAVKARTEAARRRAQEQQAVLTQEIAGDDDFLWRDLRAVLDEEVNRLPNRYRVPVVLCYLQGQTNAEAARRLGCSRGTVATLLARAREKLRRRLTQRGVSLSVGVALAALVRTAQGGAVPRTLEQVTVKAAALLAAGQTSALGALAVHAVALAKGVSKGMLMEKLKLPVAIVMMTALVGTGAGVTAYCVRAQTGGIAEVDSEDKPQPAYKTERPRPHAAPPVEQPKDQQIAMRTENFVVTAPTEAIARQVGEAAEHNRKALARQWLSKELPAWDEPCPVRVTITGKQIGGSSTFEFRDGVVVSKVPIGAIVKAKPMVIRGGMVLESPLDRIFADLLPHEMTHTILAEWRCQPLPRWADEGAAMLSESAISRARHERALERFLNTRRLLALSELLPKRDFPKDVTAFYAQSYSLTDFLVSSRGRREFLEFVSKGEDDGWDKAAQSVYGYKTVKDLEQAWLVHARKRIAEERSDEPASEALAAESRQPKPQPAPVRTTPLANPLLRKLPAGPAPNPVLVLLSEEGRLTVFQKVVYYQPVTSYVSSKDGVATPVTSYRRTDYYHASAYNSAGIRVHDAKGREIDAKELRQRLKKETIALASADGQPVDPLHLRLYKEDTLVFVLPQGSPAVPGAAPIAPPPAPAAAPPAVPTAPVPVPLPPVENPEETVPPSGSSKRAHDLDPRLGQEVRAIAVTPTQSQARSLTIEASVKGVTVESAEIQGSAQRVVYDEAQGRLELISSADFPATLYRKQNGPGHHRESFRARKVIYSLKDRNVQAVGDGSSFEP
jgi:RNA polymerase sigma factor (sigma-70 family)